MSNKVISKQSWIKIFSIKRYQDFIQEWLALYDAYFASNPSIDEELENNCFFALVNGLLDKWIIMLKKHNGVSLDNIKSVISNYQGILENEFTK